LTTKSIPFGRTFTSAHRYTNECLIYIATGNPIPHGLNGNFYSLDILRWQHSCKFENLGAISDELEVHQQNQPCHRNCNRGTFEVDDQFVEGLVHVPGCLWGCLDVGSGSCSYGSRLARLLVRWCDVVMYTHYLVPVYALYQKSLWVGLPFLALILGEVSAVIVGIVKHIPGTNFSASSLLLTGPGSYTYFG